MKLICSLAAALIVCMVLGGAAASADEKIDEARTERAEAREARADAAKKLDGLSAEDAELDAAIAVLDAHIAEQQARVDSAQQALSVATADEMAYRDRIAIALAHVERLGGLAEDRAVAVYTGLGATEGVTDLFASDPLVSVQRAALVSMVQAGDADVLDQLREINEDLELLRAGAEEAAATAEMRRGTLQGELEELAGAQQRQVELRAVLAIRIDELQAEIAELDAAQAQLTEIITQRQQEIARANEIRQRPTVQKPGPKPQSSGQGLQFPTSGTITSSFGQRWGRLHAGIDIGAPTGTGVWAADSGIVIFAGVMSGYGNVVLIDHGNGMVTLYGHMSAINTSDGASVARGELVGKVGSTGRSTGPHLHFETRINGVPKDPRAYF